MSIKKISIKEIAKMADVSIATVSRVINDNGRFSEETRQKVLDIIKQSGYQTNIVAKSLRTNISQSIGVIVPDITNEFFSTIVLAIEKHCFLNGYTVFICNTNEDKVKEEKYIQNLVSKSVDGIIYISDYPIDVELGNIPVVCIDRRPTNKKDLVSVESDNYLGGFLAGEELAKAGCKNIVVFKDYRNLSVVENRILGFKDALSKYNIVCNSDLIINIAVNFHQAEEVTLRLIDENVLFDGIFATSDQMALGALMGLRKRKIKVPQVVKLVGYDDVSAVSYTLPSITSVRQDKYKLGKIAAEVILDMIVNKIVPIKKQYIVPVKLMKRESTEY